MTREELYARLREYFDEHKDEFIDALNSLDSWNGYLNDDRFYPMYEFDELMAGVEPSALARMIYFGNDLDSSNDLESFNPNREYFRFNGCGNLESTNDPNYIYSEYIGDYTFDSFIDYKNEIELEDIIDEDMYQAILDYLGE